MRITRTVNLYGPVVLFAIGLAILLYIGAIPSAILATAWLISRVVYHYRRDNRRANR